MEYGLGQWHTVIWKSQECVLILVLMEYGLGHSDEDAERNDNVSS